MLQVLYFYPYSILSYLPYRYFDQLESLEWGFIAEFVRSLFDVQVFEEKSGLFPTLKVLSLKISFTSSVSR